MTMQVAVRTDRCGLRHSPDQTSGKNFRVAPCAGHAPLLVGQPRVMEAACRGL